MGTGAKSHTFPIINVRKVTLEVLGRGTAARYNRTEDHLASPRRPRNSLISRSNPVRDLVSQKQRAAEVVREKQRVQQLKSDLPAIIEDRVGQQMQKLETKLITDFREIGQKAMEQSTAVLSEQLNGRIDTLEQVSKLQSKTIASLRDSSQIAEQKVSSVVSQIERSLASAVPGGFELEPPAFPPLPPIEGTSSPGRVHPQFLIPEPVEVVLSEPEDISEFTGRNGFCPKCTSTDVRRANRKGVFEEFLRLFFIAPFRCRACRHKFYRF